jgi:cell division topological specificity factor
VAEERVSIFHRTLAETGGRLFGFFRAPPPRTADTAKERLQVLLALERSGSAWPNFLPQLQEDVMQAIKKYVEIDNDKVSIEVERGPLVSVLDINIELPAMAAASAAAGRAQLQTA